MPVRGGPTSSRPGFRAWLTGCSPFSPASGRAGVEWGERRAGRSKPGATLGEHKENIWRTNEGTPLQNCAHPAPRPPGRGKALPPTPPHQRGEEIATARRTNGGTPLQNCAHSAPRPLAGESSAANPAPSAWRRNSDCPANRRRHPPPKLRPSGPSAPGRESSAANSAPSAWRRNSDCPANKRRHPPSKIAPIRPLGPQPGRTRSSGRD